MQKTVKGYIFFVIICALIFETNAEASKDVTQQKLTSMEYFLDKLQSHVSCDAETKTKYWLCIRTIRFDSETGKIFMNVEILPNNPILQDLAKKEVENRDEVLLSAVSTILATLGLHEAKTAASQSERIGIIQRLQFAISDSKEIKDYVIQNTVLDTFLKSGDTVYWVKRGKSGELNLIKLLNKKN